MKFFHLSDLHIGLKLVNHDLLPDQAFVLGRIASAAAEEQPDAVVIAGDIYDRAVPSAEAVTVFDDFIRDLRAAVPDAEIMLISGNHDSGPRVNLFRGILGRERIRMIGLPPESEDEPVECVTMTDPYGPVHFYLLPFVRPSMIRRPQDSDASGAAPGYDDTLRRLLGRQRISENDRNVIVSHQFYLPAGADPDGVDRTEAEIRTVGNIDAVRSDMLERFDYAALGHIHKAMKAGSETIRYSGTPMACSLGEAGQEKGFLIVELGRKGQVSVRFRPVTPLRSIRIIKGTLGEVLRNPTDDYVRIVLTDQEDLDVIDMQDRLRHAWPNLLEIRRETGPSRNMPGMLRDAGKEKDPYELCCEFLDGPDEEVRSLLRDVINDVKEGLKA